MTLIYKIFFYILNKKLRFQFRLMEGSLKNLLKKLNYLESRGIEKKYFFFLVLIIKNKIFHTDYLLLIT